MTGTTEVSKAGSSLPPSPVSFAGTKGDRAMAGGDPRYANSTVTAFYAAPPKRASGPALEWVVVVRTGAIVDMHRFRSRFDAEVFALNVSPGFVPPPGLEA